MIFVGKFGAGDSQLEIAAARCAAFSKHLVSQRPEKIVGCHLILVRWKVYSLQLFRILDVLTFHSPHELSTTGAFARGRRLRASDFLRVSARPGSCAAAGVSLAGSCRLHDTLGQAPP